MAKRGRPPLLPPLGMKFTDALSTFVEVKAREKAPATKAKRAKKPKRQR